MARDLEITEHNTLTLLDPVEKTDVVFTHRTPTTDDRIRYMTGRYKRQGNKLIDRARSAAIDGAFAVLTGVRTGDFVIGGKPLSSKPGEEGYREDWKDLVKAAAGDLLFLMGYQLFEGNLALPDDVQLEFVSEFDSPMEPDKRRINEDIPPLAKSSGD